MKHEKSNPDLERQKNVNMPGSSGSKGESEEERELRRREEMGGGSRPGKRSGQDGSRTPSSDIGSSDIGSSGVTRGQ